MSGVENCDPDLRSATQRKANSSKTSEHHRPCGRSGNCTCDRNRRNSKAGPVGIPKQRRDWVRFGRKDPLSRASRDQLRSKSLRAAKLAENAAATYAAEKRHCSKVKRRTIVLSGCDGTREGGKKQICAIAKEKRQRSRAQASSEHMAFPAHLMSWPNPDGSR